MGEVVNQMKGTETVDCLLASSSARSPSVLLAG
jgi:hypothetical protein